MIKTQFEPFAQVNQESFRHQAQAEFSQDNFAHSLWLYRMHALMAHISPKTTVSFSNFVSKILDIDQWALESNYATGHLHVSEPHQNHTWLRHFPEHYQQLFETNKSQHGPGASLVEALDCSIVRWVFPAYDEHFGIFSKNMHLLYPPAQRPYLRNLEGKCYIHQVSKDFSHGLFDFTFANSTIYEIEEPCIFIGSRQNYGHWLFDFLGKLFSIDQLAELNQLPIVVGKLLDFQKETLQLFGYANRKLIELGSEDGEGPALYRFKKLYIPENVSNAAVKQLFQTRLAHENDHSKPKRRLYLSRKNLGDKSRIYNEDEVIHAVSRLGFEIIFPEMLSMGETKDLFGQAELIISSFGAQTANMLFTRNCPLILMIGSRYLASQDYGWSQAVVRDLFPFCDHVIPIVGNPVVEGRTVIDDICAYNPEDIEMAANSASGVINHYSGNPFGYN